MRETKNPNAFKTMEKHSFILIIVIFLLLSFNDFVKVLWIIAKYTIVLLTKVDNIDSFRSIFIVLFCYCFKYWCTIEFIKVSCLVLLQVPKCFVPVQIFWASPKPILQSVNHLFGTKCLWLPQYVNRFLVWHKKFGPAQNILRAVKGQGIRAENSKAFPPPLHSVNL